MAGIDAAEAAGHGQALLEPPPRRLDRAARRGRGEKRSQLLRQSSTPMKKFFQRKAARREGPRHARETQARALARHRPQLVEPAGAGSDFTGFASIRTSSGTMTVRDQYETS